MRAPDSARRRDWLDVETAWAAPARGELAYADRVQAQLNTPEARARTAALHREMDLRHLEEERELQERERRERRAERQRTRPERWRLAGRRFLMFVGACTLIVLAFYVYSEYLDPSGNARERKQATERYEREHGEVENLGAE